MENSRETPWRQGLVLAAQTAKELLPPSIECSDQTVAVVASHDCDIANSSDREPVVEIIVGICISALGADTHAKSARRLHIPFQTAEGQIPVEFIASHKIPVPKDALLAAVPNVSWSLRPEDLVTFQKWLAARYRRAAFANEFENRLKAKPARLDKKIAKILEVSNEHVLAILFDVDEGQEVNHAGPNDCYDLSISLLYDSTKDELTAYQATQTSADAIEDAFEKANLKGGVWENIRLLSCTPVSDNAMTVAQSRMLKQWRLDYMSLEEAPQQPSLEA